MIANYEYSHSIKSEDKIRIFCLVTETTQIFENRTPRLKHGLRKD